MSLAWPAKDPNEKLDYEIDWSARLGDDTIASSDWTVPDGLTKEQESNSTTATLVWLSGGTLGKTYEVLNRATTAAGRIMDQTALLTIAEK